MATRAMVTSVERKTAKGSGKEFFVVKTSDGNELLTYDNVSHINGKMIDYNFEQRGNVKSLKLIGVVDYSQGTGRSGGGSTSPNSGGNGKDKALPGMVLSYAKDVFIALVESGFIAKPEIPVEPGDHGSMAFVLTPLSDIYDFMMLMSKYGSRKEVLDAYVAEFKKYDEEVPF